MTAVTAIGRLIQLNIRAATRFSRISWCFSPTEKLLTRTEMRTRVRKECQSIRTVMPRRSSMNCDLPFASSDIHNYLRRIIVGLHIVLDGSGCNPILTIVNVSTNFNLTRHRLLPSYDNSGPDFFANA